MWLVGTLILFALSIGVIARVGWRTRLAPSQPVRDMSRLGGTYTGMVGTLGGFSVTSAIFVAGFDGTHSSPAFAAVIGMLLIAFPSLVFSALMYASTPDAPLGVDAVIPSLAHLLANMYGCLRLAVSQGKRRDIADQPSGMAVGADRVGTKTGGVSSGSRPALGALRPNSHAATTTSNAPIATVSA